MTRIDALEILRSIDQSFKDTEDFNLKVSAEELAEIREHVLDNVQTTVDGLVR